MDRDQLLILQSVVEKRCDSYLRAPSVRCSPVDWRWMMMEELYGSCDTSRATAPIVPAHRRAFKYSPHLTAWQWNDRWKEKYRAPIPRGWLDSCQPLPRTSMSKRRYLVLAHVLEISHRSRGWRLCRFCQTHVEDEVHVMLECNGHPQADLITCVFR